MGEVPERSGIVVPDWVSLVYELLDAHMDTTHLVQTSADSFRWKAHLDYLRRLQHVGRGMLARAAQATPAGSNRLTQPPDSPPPTVT